MHGTDLLLLLQLLEGQKALAEKSRSEQANPLGKEC